MVLRKDIAVLASLVATVGYMPLKSKIFHVFFENELKVPA